jgi:hypothetical protein
MPHIYPKVQNARAYRSDTDTVSGGLLAPHGAGQLELEGLGKLLVKVIPKQLTSFQAIASPCMESTFHVSLEQNTWSNVFLDLLDLSYT